MNKSNEDLAEQVEMTATRLSFELEKYRTLFEVSADALSILDLETGRFIECNQSAIDMHGVENEENFLNLTPADLSPQYQPCGSLSAELAIEKINKTFSEGPQMFQWQHIKLDGTQFPCLVSLTALPVKGKKLVLAIGRDITELTETQKKLQNVQKAALAGQLSAGICHDLNNILNIISGNAELILINEQDQKNKQFATKIFDGINRAKSVTDRLLKLAKPSDSNVKKLKVDELISKELSFYKEAIKKDINFISSLNSNAFIVVDVNTFKDSILNLVVNASKAIIGTGQITIETTVKDNFNHQGCYVFSHPNTSDRYVRIKVIDTGVGIPADYIENIFNPFETRQKSGKGIGLGLNVVGAFVINNDCGLTVSSKVGVGTEFCIWVPEASKAAEIGNKPAIQPLPKLDKKHIVVVEDEEELLSIFIQALEWAGASVAGFLDPYKAQHYIERHGNSIDLVQTDQTLGFNIHGSDLIKWINQNFPNITTVLLTGFSVAPELAKLNASILEKPISFRELPYLLQKAMGD